MKQSLLRGRAEECRLGGRNWSVLGEEGLPFLQRLDEKFSRSARGEPAAVLAHDWSTKQLNVRFEALSPVVMKSIVFWDTPLVLLKVNRRFGGPRRLHLSASVDFQTDYMALYPRSSQIHGVHDVVFK
jgi:hypothetical protein